MVARNATPLAKWYAFLAQLSELGTPTAVCGLKGMPSYAAFDRKMKADPLFARRVDALRVRPTYDDAAWDTLLAHLKRCGIGEACALPGMPSKDALHRKRLKDRSFDARVRAVLEAPGAQHLHRPTYGEADWAALLSRLGSMPLRRACQFEGSPARATTFKRMRDDPAFAARVAEARGRQARSLARFDDRLDEAAVEAVWTRFLEALATGPLLAVCAMPGMPCVSAYQQKRRRDHAFDERVEEILRAKGTGWSRVAPARWDAFLAAVDTCRSIASLCREPGMPCEATVHLRCRNDHGFKIALAEAVRRRTKARIAAALGARRRRPAAAKPARATALAPTFARQPSHDAIYRAANASVPASLPPVTRDDIIGDMVPAVLEGDLAMGDLRARAKAFVKEHWRMFGTLRDLSLDALMFDDGGATLGDRVSGHGADHW